TAARGRGAASDRRAARRAAAHRTTGGSRGARAGSQSWGFPRSAPWFEPLRIVWGLGKDSCRPALADHVHLDRYGRLRDRPRNIREREALLDVVAVGPRGHEADLAVARPDGLETGDVGAGVIDRQQHQPLARAAALALGERRLATDEVALVERDEAVEACHGRRIGLGKFERPDPVAFLEPQAVLRAHADGLHAERRAVLEQRLVQGALFARRHGDFIAEFARE